MKNSLIISIIALPMLFACNEQPKRLASPETSTVDTVDVFGTEVPDPYSGLKMPIPKLPNNGLRPRMQLLMTSGAEFLSTNAIKERLSEVWNYATQSVPQKKVTNCSITVTMETNHAVLYVKSIKDSIEKVLIDPNLFLKTEQCHWAQHQSHLMESMLHMKKQRRIRLA